MRKPGGQLTNSGRDKLHIWILDDSPSDAMLVEISLRGTGMEVTSERITDGDAAMRRIDEAVNSGSIPDLIVLDIHLPRVDGVEVARVIQSTPGFSAKKIIAMSSFVNPKQREVLVALGVGRVIEKPADLQSFRQLMHDAVLEVMKP